MGTKDQHCYAERPTTENCAGHLKDANYNFFRVEYTKRTTNHVDDKGDSTWAGIGPMCTRMDCFD